MKKSLAIIVSAAAFFALALPSSAQPFSDPLEVSLTGEFSVTRAATGTNFQPIGLAGVVATGVALTWETAPSFDVVHTNGAGWSVSLQGPATLTTAGSDTPLTIRYVYGTGVVLSTGDTVTEEVTPISGTFTAGAKVISAAATTSGSYNYTIGSFECDMAANQDPGTYGGADLLTTTFANTP